MNPLKDVTSIISESGKVADNLITTDEERQAELSKRHSVDMMSDSWLSKNVRPIAFIFVMVCQTIVVVSSIWVTLDPWIIGQVGSLMITVTGFYFQSRKAEKIAAKNAEANLRIQEMNTKAEIKQDKRKAREERREKRREERKE